MRPIKHWPRTPDLDYNRLVRSLRRKGDHHHVPFFEVAADAEFIAAVLGEPTYQTTNAVDSSVMKNQMLDQRIRFWYGLGLDTLMNGLFFEVQVDARHSFEDVIELVESFLARHGDKMAVIGGVDMDILASGNSIANYMPVQNFLAMIDEGWRFYTQ